MLRKNLQPCQETPEAAAVYGQVIGEARVTIQGEVRTVDSEISPNPRLWGKGRDNAVQHGTNAVETSLCMNLATNVELGLSRNLSTWGSDSACPTGT